MTARYMHNEMTKLRPGQNAANVYVKSFGAKTSVEDFSERNNCIRRVSKV